MMYVIGIVGVFFGVLMFLLAGWWQREALRMRRAYNEWKRIADNYKILLQQEQARTHLQVAAYEQRIGQRNTEYVPVVAVSTLSDKPPS